MPNTCNFCNQPIAKNQPEKTLVLTNRIVHFHDGHCYSEYISECYHDYANHLVDDNKKPERKKHE
jgi:hypothetical protein